MQSERRGTAHATLAARAAIARGFDDILVDLRRHAADLRANPYVAARGLADGAGLVALGFEPATRPATAG